MQLEGKGNLKGAFANWICHSLFTLRGALIHHHNTAIELDLVTTSRRQTQRGIFLNEFKLKTIEVEPDLYHGLSGDLFYFFALCIHSTIQSKSERVKFQRAWGDEQKNAQPL